MKQTDKDKMYEAFVSVGLSADAARKALIHCLAALEPPKRLKAQEIRMRESWHHAEVNHPDGWYRKFEKKSGKRNLK